MGEVEVFWGEFWVGFIYLVVCLKFTLTFDFIVS